MLRAGFATGDITPRPGALFSGSDVRGRVGVIDGALHVRVVLLDDEQGGTLALGMADVGGFTRGQDRAIREAMADALNLQIGQVRINASHNHSAPKTYLRVDEILRPYGVPFAEAAWVERIEQAFVDAAREAGDRAKPVLVSGAVGRVEGLAANRTVYRPDGSTETRYGSGGNQEMRDAPEGRIDPEVTVLHFQTKKGGAVGTIFNYACHATSVGGRGELVSPDFPGYAAEAIERETGAPAFFLQGAGGNVGTGKYADSTTEGARRMGDRLARSVLKAMEGMMPLAPAPLSLDAWTERIELDERLPSLEEARKRLDEAARQGARHSDLWRGAALLEVLEDAERSRQCELFVVHGGEWSLAGLPAESFVESALAIKSASSCPFPLVGAYYDCTLWYIPTRAAFRDAGFETRGGWNYAAPGTSEQLTRSIIRSDGGKS